MRITWTVGLTEIPQIDCIYFLEPSPQVFLKFKQKRKPTSFTMHDFNTKMSLTLNVTVHCTLTNIYELCIFLFSTHFE